MKQIYLTALALSLSLMSFGQLVLDKTYSFTNQDKYTSYFLDKTADPQGAGANVLWNFASLKIDSAFSNVAVAISPSSKLSYPNADVAQITSYNDTTFYQTQGNSELINWGYFSSFLGSTKYTNGQSILKFPFAFAETFKDSIKGTGSIKTSFSPQPITTNRKGEAVVTYDGYGSLILPGNKAYGKVARIKSVLKGIDKNPNSPMEFASTITSYSWYAEGINYPVLTITSIVSPSLINDQVVIQSGPYDPAAVLDSKFANSIALSPNPANDHFILKFHNQKSNATMVYIKDASGKTLQITNIGISDNAHAINISDLESGLYFVEIESDGLKAVKKLVKN